jgi:hypothetical protein
VQTWPVTFENDEQTTRTIVTAVESTRFRHFLSPLTVSNALLSFVFFEVPYARFSFSTSPVVTLASATCKQSCCNDSMCTPSAAAKPRNFEDKLFRIGLESLIDELQSFRVSSRRVGGKSQSLSLCATPLAPAITNVTQQHATIRTTTTINTRRSRACHLLHPPRIVTQSSCRHPCSKVR